VVAAYGIHTLAPPMQLNKLLATYGRPRMIDELSAIARYMASEMNHNPLTESGRRIREALTIGDRCLSEWKQAPKWLTYTGFTPKQCTDMSITGFMMACKLWKDMVGYECPWDHKPMIERNFPSSITRGGKWHIYDHTAYFYDVWSNMHYGCVGRAVGFDLDTLLDGAGLAQANRDNKMPFRFWQLRSYDHAEDRLSIKLGWDLYQQRSFEAQALTRVVVQTNGITKEPAAKFAVVDSLPMATGR
jgi:hypothetical protein